MTASNKKAALNPRQEAQTAKTRERTGKLINARQAAFLYIALVTVYKLVQMPTVLVERASRDGWLAALILMLWEGLLLVVFVVISVLCPGKTLQDLLGKTVGKVVTRIIFGLFGLFLFFRLYLSMASSEQFLFTNLYDLGGWLTVGIPIAVLLVYGVGKGLRAIARAMELVGIIVISITVVGIICMLTQADFTLLAPVLHDGGQPLFRAVGSAATGTGEGILMMLLLGRVERFRLVRNMAVGYGISTFIVVGFHLCFYGYYGDTGVHLKYGAALADMLEYMRGSDSLARADLFVLLALLVLILIKLLFYAWGVGVCMRTALGVKSDTHAARMLHFAPWALLLVVIELFFQSQITGLIEAMGTGWAIGIFAVIQVGLPVLALIAAAVARGRRSKLKKIYHCKKGT